MTRPAVINVYTPIEQKGFVELKKDVDDVVEKTAQKQQMVAAQAAKAASAAMIGIGAITIEFFKAAQSAIAFEASFAGIRKTVEATEEQFDALAESVKELSTISPVSTDDLNRIGELGGQLGVAVENLPSFIQVVSQLAVTTNLTVENAALGLARLDAIAQTNGETFSNIASVIVDLGNNFAATESEIMTTVLRIQQAAAQVGAGTEDALAFATALQAIGVPAQAGGTAVARVFQSINSSVISAGDEVQLFAQIAANGTQDFSDFGGSVTEAFSAFFQDDPARAVQAFIEGLGALNDSGTDVVGLLDKLGLSQRRTMLALLGLAEAGGLVGETLDLATKAMIENTAATEEALKKYATLESQLQITKNIFNELQVQIGDQLVPTLKDANRFVQNFLLGIVESENAMGFLKVALGSLTLALAIFGAQLQRVQAIAMGLVSGPAGFFVLLGTTLGIIGARSAAATGELEMMRRTLEAFSGIDGPDAQGVQAMLFNSAEFQEALEKAPEGFDKDAFLEKTIFAIAGDTNGWEAFVDQILNEQQFVAAMGDINNFLASGPGSSKGYKLLESGFIEGFDNTVTKTREGVEAFIEDITAGYEDDYIDKSVLFDFLMMSPKERAMMVTQNQELVSFYNGILGPIEKNRQVVKAYNDEKERTLRIQAMEQLGITEVMFPAQETMIRQTMEQIRLNGDAEDSYSSLFDEVKNSENIFERIAEQARAGAEGLFNTLDGVGELAQMSAEEINKNLADKIRLKEIFEQQIDFLVQEGFDDAALLFSSLGPEYAQVIQNLLNDADQLNLFEVMLEGANLSTSNELKDALFDSVDGVSEEAVDKMTELGRNTIGGMIEGIREESPELYKTMRKVFDNTIKVIEEEGGFGSPSRVTKELGNFLMLGFVEGIQQGYPNLEMEFKGTMIDFLDLIKQSVGEATNEINSAFGSQFGVFNAQRSRAKAEKNLNELISEQTELLKGNTAAQNKAIQDATDKRDFLKLAYEEGTISLAEYQLAEQELDKAENARANRLSELDEEIEDAKMRLAQQQFGLANQAFQLLQMGPGAIETFKKLGQVVGIDNDVINKIVDTTSELADTLGQDFANEVDGIAEKYFNTNLKIEQEAITINIDKSQFDAGLDQIEQDLERVTGQERTIKLTTGSGTIYGNYKGGRIPGYYGGGFLGAGIGLVGEYGPELIRAIPGGGVDITPIGKTTGSSISVQNLNVNVSGVPSDPMQARKAAIAIRKELSKLDREGLIGTGIRGR
tara:strand:+ start:6068 stop:9814 length:3747 start_codon:yes stop_codon:yes gene_type:complete